MKNLAVPTLLVMIQTFLNCIQTGEFSQIRFRKPFVPKSAEPPLNFRLLGWRIRMAVMDSRSCPGCQQFHLAILVGTAIVKIPQLRYAEFRNRRFHHLEKRKEIILVEHSRACNITGCIIDQGYYINSLLSAFNRNLWPNTAVSTPYFIDMRALIWLQEMHGR